MNLKNCLVFNRPFRWKNICDIYPISVEYACSFDNELDFLKKLTPYRLTKEVMNLDLEKTKDISIFQLIFAEKDLLLDFTDTIQEITKTDNIEVIPISDIDFELRIDGNEGTLNRDNFEEFCSFVLQMTCLSKLEKEEELEFDSEEGKQRWLRLKKAREKYRALHDQVLHTYDIINIVQFGGKSYISIEEIEKWNYWKLIKAYESIIQLNNYNDSFKVYLQCGDKKIIDKHWSELIKL